MKSETVLTDDEILNEWDSAECIFDFGRAIEQAVLQSDEVQDIKKDRSFIDWIDENFGVDIVCLDSGEWEVSGIDIYGSGSTLRDAIDAAIRSAP